MTRTQSSMIPLGTKAPEFKLIDVSTDQSVTLKEMRSGSGTVVMFVCNHCPYVKHIQQTILDVARLYLSKGIAFIAINSNDPIAYPEDSPEEMKTLAEALDFPFPYLFDETQEVARSYGATCTPDFFVFNGHLECVYRGQFDQARPGNHEPVTGKDLAKALDCLLENKEIPSDQQPSMGCNIKYRNPS